MRLLNKILTVCLVLSGLSSYAALDCLKALEKLTGGTPIRHTYKNFVGLADLEKALGRLVLPEGGRGISLDDFETEVLKVSAVMLGLRPSTQYQGSLLFSEGTQPHFSRDKIFDKLAFDRRTDAAILNNYLDQTLRHVLGRLITRGADTTALSAAPEIVISTHQSAELQKKLKEFLKTQPKLGALNWVALAAPEYDPISKALIAQSNFVRLSHGGELDFPVMENGVMSPAITAKKIHLMGGFCNYCVLRTALEASQISLETNKHVEIIIHQPMTYAGDKKQSITELRTSGGLEEVASDIQLDLGTEYDPMADGWGNFTEAMHESTLDVFDYAFSGERQSPTSFLYTRDTDKKTVLVRYE